MPAMVLEDVGHPLHPARWDVLGLTSASCPLPSLGSRQEKQHWPRI